MTVPTSSSARQKKPNKFIFLLMNNPYCYSHAQMGNKIFNYKQQEEYDSERLDGQEVCTDVTVFVIFLWQLTTSSFTGPSIYWAVELGKYEAPAESLTLVTS